jgi:pimeloyl-ACP methyl ester carboxylesterase
LHAQEANHEAPHKLARKVIGDARKAAADPANRDYAGWLEFLAMKAEKRLGSKTPLTEKDAPLLRELGEWPTRIARDPDAFSKQRGIIEWAYRSTADTRPHPFALAIPDDYDPKRSWPMEVDLHGFGGNHLTYARVGRRHPRPFFRLYIHGRARGVEYVGLSELDVLETMEYVQAHFDIDADRIHLYGYSMGGYGGFSVATRNADRFASFRPIAGSGIGRQEMNLLNLPTFGIHGSTDVKVSAALVAGPIRRLAQHGADAIVHNYNGINHGIRGNSAIMAEGHEWAFGHVRNLSARRVYHAAVDEHTRASYWVEVIEWGSQGQPAVIDAHVGDDNTLQVSLDNVQTARFDLTVAPVDRDAALKVVVDETRIKTIAPPLPDSLYVDLVTNDPARKPGADPILTREWRVSDDAPVLPQRRLHFAGGAIALYHGEPLMVVWGTHGDEAMNKRLHDIARIAIVSADGKWQRSDDTGKRWPVFRMVYGRHAAKPDTDVTAEDMAKYNLLLLGDATQNSVVAQMADLLPVTISGGVICSNDGFEWDYRDRGLGLLYVNPIQPRRYIYWVAADSPEFFRQGRVYPARTMMDFQGSIAGPPDFMVMDTQQTQLAAARRFDSRWNWAPGYGKSPVVQTRMPVIGRKALTLARAVKLAAGADFGLTQGECWYSSEFESVAGVTRKADVVSLQYSERIATLELTGAEVLAAHKNLVHHEATFKPKSTMNWAGACRFDPAPTEDTIDPARVYRVAFPPWAIFTFSKYAKVSVDTFRTTDILVKEALERFWESNVGRERRGKPAHDD